MSTYIVGDIQGCYTGLKKLLASVSFDPANDTLWAVGDLIGRGDESLETLVYLHSLGKAFNSVLGNHDLHFLAISQGIRKAKPADKFDRLLASQQRKKLVKWLRQFPLAAKLDKNTLICHAGLYPNWGFKKALKYSDQVCAILKSDDWTQMLSQMYGSKPQAWDKTLPSPERENFIINSFTRMRFVTADRQLNFDAKGALESADEGLFPWFKLSNAKLKPRQKVIFGHWAALKGETHSSQHIGLDTGYIWGQALTLLELETMQRYSFEFKDNLATADTLF